MASDQGYYSYQSDEELVLASLIGDLEAFDELVLRFRGAVIVVAQQVLHSREIAEDVAQEALLLAFKALPQLETPASFAGWVCAITRHRARRLATREQRSEATAPSELDRLILANSRELGLHSANQPDEALTRQQDQAAIGAALAQLPPEYQIVLKLRYFEEWQVERIANFLSLPVSTTKWRLHYGRKLMRRHLSQQWSQPNEEGLPRTALEAKTYASKPNATSRTKSRTPSGPKRRRATAAPDAAGHRQNCPRSQSDRQFQRCLP